MNFYYGDPHTASLMAKGRVPECAPQLEAEVVCAKLSVFRRLSMALWQRRPRFNVESMYPRDSRDNAAPDPFKPTSLSGKMVADVLLLNSKR